MDVRIRFSELLEEHGLTPYALARQSGGRIAPNTAYRLRKANGRVRYFDRELLAAMCDVMGIEDYNVLFSRDDEEPPEPVQPPARKRTAKRA